MNNKDMKLEKKFLSYLFSEKKYVAKSISLIKPEYLPKTYSIYEILSNYYIKYKGIATDEIIDVQFSNRNISNDTMVLYKSIINEVRALPTKDDAEFEAIFDQLVEQYKRGALANLADQIVNINPNDCSTEKLMELEDKVKANVSKITADNSSTRAEGAISASAKERYERYKNLKNNPESIIVYPTGFKVIDDAEGGFRPGELIYIIGRKGDGKSVLMLNLAHNLWANQKNVILFSLEISKEDYERRFDALAADVSSNGLKLGKLTDHEEALYVKYLKNVSQNKTIDGKPCGAMYIVDVPGICTPAYIDSKIDEVEGLLGIKFDVCISDYAGIMAPNIRQDAKRHDQGQIALDLKRLARSRNMAVISAAQMTRSGKDEEKADTSHVAESDQISDHIDWGIAIRSVSDTQCKIESFKTRDAAPFEFHAQKKYSCMKIIELAEDQAEDQAAWDNIKI